MKKLKTEPQTAVLVMLKGTQMRYATSLVAWLTERGIAYNAPGLVKAQKAKKAVSASR
jgi:hypothetical protein